MLRSGFIKMKTLFIALLSFLFISCAQSKVADKTKSDNFKDGAFYNNSNVKLASFWDIVVENHFGDIERAEWPEWVDTATDEYPLARMEGSDIRVTFINQSTFLLQTAGFNILTDPVFAERVSPFSFIGPKRVHSPGINIDTLPKIDVIIISHDHYDHLDLEAVEKIINRDKAKVYTGLGVAEHLSDASTTTELDWNDNTQVADNFKLWFLEVQHNSGRSLINRNSTLWGGFILQIEENSIYFGGDSGYAPHYKYAGKTFNKIDVAFLPIGAYAPRKVFKAVHLDPFEAVQAHQDLNAKLSIGMHYGSFQLTAETRDEPIKLLEKAKHDAGIKASEFITLDVGKPLTIQTNK
jgi:L-ascorbate metabolism protein UlaG (beta-lactamase superfamily)